MYLYDNTKVPRLDDGFLYHFTTADSLLKIVEHMTLQLSSFTLLNDLNETEVNCERSGGMDVINVQNFIKEHCGLICFTQNYKQQDNPFCQSGCNHPRMWAQYADNNQGACVVINEAAFKKRNKEVLHGKFFKIENVDYSLTLYNKWIQTNGEPEKFIKENWKHLFFNKYCDWEQEHERRLFGIDLPKYLSIKGCIEFICLGRRFSNENLQRLVHLIVSPGYESYKQFIPHDFAQQQNSNGSVLPMPIASKIIDTVKQLNEDATRYWLFLKKEGY